MPATIAASAISRKVLDLFMFYTPSVKSGAQSTSCCNPDASLEVRL